MAAKKKAAKPGRPRRNSVVDEDTHKVEQSAISPAARPSKAVDGRRTRRRKKGSVGDFRDILTVHPKEEGFSDTYVTRWVKDIDERGSKIMHYYNNDWDFVRADEVSVGENFVYKSRGAESIVRVPAGTNVDTDQWMFLMKKYRDWSEADQMEAQAEIDKTENFMKRKRNPEKEEDRGDGEVDTGFYGEVKTVQQTK